MTTHIPFDRLDAARPPAVVLGDLSLIRPVGAARIPVILATPDPDDIALRSRFVTAHRVVPPLRGDRDALARAADHLAALGAELAHAFGRKVPLLYNSDRHLELIYRHRDALEATFALLLNAPDLAWALHDKDRFSAVAERAGVRAPRTLHAGDDLEAGLAALREPLVVKPRRKDAWHDVQRDLLDGHGKARVFATRRELLAHPGFRRHRDAVVVQEYLAGDVTALVSFHGFADADGRLLASYCGRKLRTYPAFAGESCYIELVHDAAVDAAGREVCARLGLRGPFKIDLLRDLETGACYTLEVNARYNLWNQLGAARGVNLPAIGYDYLVDGRAPARAPGYARGRWVHFYRDYLAFRDRRGRGPRALGAWLGSIADPRHQHETFAWSDPAPFVRWARDLVRRTLESRA